MSDDPDTPCDPNLARLAGTRMPDGGGTLSRMLQADAAKRRQYARRMRDRGDQTGAARTEHDAAYLERHADRFRDPANVVGGPLAPGVGGEVVAGDQFGPYPYQEIVRQPPDMLAAEATEHRMTLTAAISGPALTLALDAAESIAARNALERTLMHQVGAAHVVGMAILARAHEFAARAHAPAPEGHQPLRSIEAARMAAAAARLLETSQRAMLTFKRLRNGGRQVVTVQYVTVGDGGQAVVAGTVKRRGRRK